MTEIPTPAQLSALLDTMTRIAAAAAAAIVAVERLAVREKADSSPVTAADEAAEAVILSGLRDAAPGLAIVSEESAASADPHRLGEVYFMVDPLDGTREFIAGRAEYTVNIALIVGGEPIAGVVAAPATGMAWRGARGLGAERLGLDGSERTPIQTRRWPANPVALVSRSHLDPATGAFMASIPHAVAHGCGSALKFCRLAEGVADIYPRLAPTSEWDIAAGHAMLEAAGGRVTAPDGSPICTAAAKRTSSCRPSSPGPTPPGPCLRPNNPSPSVPKPRWQHNLHHVAV